MLEVVSLGSANPSISLVVDTFSMSARVPNSNASAGQVVTQAGLSPLSILCTQKVHFSTFLVSGWYLGALCHQFLFY